MDATWTDLLRVIERETCAEVRERIESRLRVELEGRWFRVPVPPARPKLTRTEIFKVLAACHSNVDCAARKLGVSRRVIWGAMKKATPPKPPRTVPR